MITHETIVEHLRTYLNGQSSLAEVVSWAEDSLAEADFDERDFNLIRDVVARIGLADVRTFGLNWDDVTQMLSRLGYRTRVEFESASS